MPSDVKTILQLLITVGPEKIRDEKCHFMVAELESNIVGYYGLERFSMVEYELIALFVEPEYIGTGIGRFLIKHALNNVAERGGSKLTIQGDPNAESFYRASGGRLVGSRESESISGRYLPVFEVTISPEAEDAD
jgi:N-acetylglutamate synthase-like GNAT family acetyltransferase